MIDYDVVIETSEELDISPELESESETVTLAEVGSSSELESESETETLADEIETESESIRYIVLEAPTSETIDYSGLLNEVVENQSLMYELVSLEYEEHNNYISDSLDSLSSTAHAVRIMMIVLLLMWLFLLTGGGRKH